MNKYVKVLVLIGIAGGQILTCGVLMAEFSPQITDFLKTFPDKMSCHGTEVSFITDKRREMPQRMTISISDKGSDHPLIEVLAPSSSTPKRAHFKIGDGY